MVQLPATAAIEYVAACCVSGGGVRLLTGGTLAGIISGVLMGLFPGGTFPRWSFARGHFWSGGFWPGGLVAS